MLYCSCVVSKSSSPFVACSPAAHWGFLPITGGTVEIAQHKLEERASATTSTAYVRIFLVTLGPGPYCPWYLAMWLGLSSTLWINMLLSLLHSSKSCSIPIDLDLDLQWSSRRSKPRNLKNYLHSRDFQVYIPILSPGTGWSSHHKLPCFKNPLQLSLKSCKLQHAAFAV